MRFFIKARWWSDNLSKCTQSDNFTIDESPHKWLTRQRERMKQSVWTSIIVDSCCQVPEDSTVDSEPTF